MDEKILRLIEEFKADPQYGHNWTYGEKAAQKIIKGVEAKDYRELHGLKYPDTAKFSRAVFHILTGIKLPKTQKGSEAALKAFATPESIKAYEWEILERDATNAATSLEQEMLWTGKESISRKDFIDRAIADGFIDTEECSVGSRSRTRPALRLRKPDGSHYLLKEWNEMVYARYAVAIAQKQLDSARQ